MKVKNGEVQNCPPYTNRGAENTLTDGLRAVIDWVGVTLKEISKEDLIEGVLGLNLKDFVEVDYGKNGYRRSMKSGNIMVYYDGREGMGIHLEISGQGCREYEGYEKRPWAILFCLLLDLKANFTRLDLAIDDFKGYFTIGYAKQKISRGEVVSKFKTAHGIRKWKMADGSTIGETLYFGSPTSRIKVRMYDKLLKSLADGTEIPEEAEESKRWNRTELELRDERAIKAAWLIAIEEMPVGEVVCGILKHYIRFVNKGSDTNKSRWETAPFWETFLGKVDALRLAEDPKERTIEQSMVWIDKQVAPTLAAVRIAAGDKVLDEMIDKAVERLKPKDWDKVNRHLRRLEELKEKEKELYDENSDRALEMWKRRRKVVWKLQGIEKDPISDVIRSKHER